MTAVQHDHTEPVLGCRCAERARLAQGMTAEESERAAAHLASLLPSQRPIPTAPVPDVTYVRTDPRRPSLLALVRRPSRTAQLEGLLDRHRWANAGLRERLAELTVRHEATLDAIAVIVDEEARVIGHAHPVIVRVRAQLDAAAQERPA